jgi:DNA-binding response OmpR family regulator
LLFETSEFMDVHPFLIGVVDDDPSVLESLEELLASGGYKSLLFDSAEAFLGSNGFQQVDCLISDIGMPAMSGWELLQIARTECPNLPVILVTARDEEYARETIEAKGASYLFRKPFDGRELLAALDAVLRPDKCNRET